MRYSVPDLPIVLHFDCDNPAILAQVHVILKLALYDLLLVDELAITYELAVLYLALVDLAVWRSIDSLEVHQLSFPVAHVFVALAFEAAVRLDAIFPLTIVNCSVVEDHLAVAVLEVAFILAFV